MIIYILLLIISNYLHYLLLFLILFIFFLEKDLARCDSVGCRGRHCDHSCHYTQIMTASKKDFLVQMIRTRKIIIDTIKTDGRSVVKHSRPRAKLNKRSDFFYIFINYFFINCILLCLDQCTLDRHWLATVSRSPMAGQ